MKAPEGLPYKSLLGVSYIRARARNRGNQACVRDV